LPGWRQRRQTRVLVCSWVPTSDRDDLLNLPSDKPGISVITVCLNAARTIERTLDSYQNQRAANTELIVVDGGSTDATPAILARYSGAIERLIQEPDQGIADAMNKGLEAARGDYLFFLHADDHLAGPTALHDASQWLDGSKDIVAFNLLFGSAGKYRLTRPRSLGHYCRFKTPFLHQATFCHRRLFDQIGQFDLQFRVCMDYDFFLRAYRYGASCQRVQKTLTVMSDQGVSSKRDWSAISARLDEEFRVHRKHQENPVELLWYWPWWLLYPLYKRFRSRKQYRNR